MNENGFVKLNRTADVEELIIAAPNAFILATVIALRARYRPGVGVMGLTPGEALLGDHEKYGMTRQQYRTALNQLCDWGFASTRATTLGNVAKLTDTRLFDVLNFSSNQQLTSGQPPSNQQPTTNKKERKVTMKEAKEKDIVGSADASVVAGATSNETQKFTPPTDDEFWQFVRDEKLDYGLADSFIAEMRLTGWRVKRGEFLMAQVEDWKNEFRTFCKSQLV